MTSGQVHEVQAFNMELIDAGALSNESLRVIRDSDAKAELIFQWIQQVVVENIKTGILSIPPPILSRSFQEIANGMVHFHEAMKISNVPFPFPYAQPTVLPSLEPSTSWEATRPTHQIWQRRVSSVAKRCPTGLPSLEPSTSWEASASSLGTPPC